EEGAGRTRLAVGVRPRGPRVAPRHRALAAVVEPVVGPEEAPEPEVLRRQGRKPGPEALARPPGAARVAGGREAVAIQRRPDEARQGAGKGIVREQAEHAGVAVEELPHQMERPGVALGA